MNAWRLLHASLALGLIAFAASCAALVSLDDLGSDAAVVSDVATEMETDVVKANAPDAGFVIAATPAHVTEDPGDSFSVSVDLNRAIGFSEAVTVTINGLPSGVTATPLTIAGTDSSGSFMLTTGASTPVTNAEIGLTVVGTNPEGTIFASSPLGFRLGSLLVPDGAGNATIPTYVTKVNAKAWGAGGGGGHPPQGGPGGGGGFVAATLPVNPGETLFLFVGSGGGVQGSTESGGGGGGFSGVRRGATYLLIAGGGGGGGWDYYASLGAMIGGGGGGGLSAQAGFSASGSGGGGGTQTSGGVGEDGDAGSGSSLQGGPGAGGGTPGGGGGSGELDSPGAGGGGGGWFGGGAGSAIVGGGPFPMIGGGGGGSGYVDPSGTNVVMITGNASACANASDPDYVVGVGVGGPVPNADPHSGGHGLTIVRLPKP